MYCGGTDWLTGGVRVSICTEEVQTLYTTGKLANELHCQVPVYLPDL